MIKCYPLPTAFKKCMFVYIVIVRYFTDYWKRYMRLKIMFLYWTLYFNFSEKNQIFHIIIFKKNILAHLGFEHIILENP